MNSLNSEAKNHDPDLVGNRGREVIGRLNVNVFEGSVNTTYNH
jgi:hypothetical protein